MENEDIVVLQAENGEDVEFREIAGIALRGNFYLILQPIVLLEGMSEDEAFVFKVTDGKNGDQRFDLELDDDVVDQVFEEYYRLLEEQE